MSIVSGGSGADTIGTTVPTPLTVAVVDSTGKPAAGTAVRFTIDGSQGPRILMAAGPNSSFGPDPLETISDANGRARVYYSTGLVAGSAAVRVTAPAFAVTIADTVIVRPGLRVKLRAPTDTAVFINAILADFGSAVVDRAGNAYPDAVTYTSSDQAVSISQNIITGRVFGQARVTASSVGYSATINVAVVPQGSITAREWSGSNVGVVTFDLDRSNYRFLAWTLRNPICEGCALPLVKPRWNPGGTRIVFGGL